MIGYNADLYRTQKTRTWGAWLNKFRATYGTTPDMQDIQGVKKEIDRLMGLQITQEERERLAKELV